MEFKWFSCIFKKQKNLNIQYTAADLDIIGLGLFCRIQIQPDPILFAGYGSGPFLLQIWIRSFLLQIWIRSFLLQIWIRTILAADMDPDHFCGIKIPTNRIGLDPIFLDFNNKKVVESAAQKNC